MAKASQKTQRDFAHTWFIREWAELAGFTQADAQRVLGWSKAKAYIYFANRPESLT